MSFLTVAGPPKNPHDQKICEINEVRLVNCNDEKVQNIFSLCIGFGVIKEDIVDAVHVGKHVQGWHMR